MRQELQVWQSEVGSRLWLSRLVAAMDDAARPELRCRKVERRQLAKAREHLSRSPSPQSSPAASQERSGETAAPAV